MTYFFMAFCALSEAKGMDRYKMRRINKLILFVVTILLILSGCSNHFEGGEKSPKCDSLG